MIDISTLTPEDIGKEIVYEDRSADGKILYKREIGTLSSWNNTFIFVKFKAETGAACLPDTVHWGMVYNEFLFNPNEKAKVTDDYFPENVNFKIFKNIFSKNKI